MTALPPYPGPGVPTSTQPSVADVPQNSARWSGAAIASFALGILFAAGLGIFRVANPLVTYLVDRSTGVIDVLGAFGLFTIVLVAIVVALGHVGLAATLNGARRGHSMAVAGTTLGYVLVLIYVTTLVSAAIASSFNDNGTFVQNVFYWV